MTIPSDPAELLELVDDLPRLPTLATRGVLRLGSTSTLLAALRLSADAELIERGYSTAHGNPLDQILADPEERHPLTLKLITAMTRANRASGFAPREWRRGERVRLMDRPAPHHGLPSYIRPGAEGELLRDLGSEGVPGWQVSFDVHGTWWTTTASLELI